MNDNKLIIGLSGKICAGKDTSAQYIEDIVSQKLSKKVTHLHFSDLLTDFLAEMGVEKSRKNYHNLSQIFFKHFGPSVFADAVYKKTLESNSDIIIWNGMRSAYDVSLLKRFKNHIIVYIEANLESRYERLLKRNRNSGDITKSFEEFKQDQSRSTEQYIDEIKKESNLVINNVDGKLEQSLLTLEIEITKVFEKNDFS